MIAVLALGTAVATAADRQPTVLVLGDSLSAAYGMALEQSWVALLEQRLQAHDPEWRVVNASVSGETTGGGLARLPRALEQHEPTIVIIELGGNDGLRARPVAEVRENLARMIELSREAGAGVLLAGIRLPPNYGAAYVQRFEAVFGELAETHDIALVEFFMEDVALDATLMQADGIHPNADAQPVLLDNVWPRLLPLLGD